MGTKRYGRHSEEKRIRDRVIRPMLEGRGWLVEVTHGNRYVKGFPDLYLSHPQFGQRWVDVKVEDDYEYTQAQRDKWPRWHRFGTGIWIMTGATEDQYARLFDVPNWLDYWKPRYGDPFKEFDLDELLDTIDDME